MDEHGGSFAISEGSLNCSSGVAPPSRWWAGVCRNEPPDQNWCRTEIVTHRYGSSNADLGVPPPKPPWGGQSIFSESAIEIRHVFDGFGRATKRRDGGGLILKGMVLRVVPTFGARVPSI